MSAGKAWGLGLLAISGAAGLWWLLSSFEEPQSESKPTPQVAERAPASTPARTGPVRPSTPPVPGRDEPPKVEEPTLPPDAAALRRAAYEEAVAKQQPKPGEQAFRAMVSAFMVYNEPLAKAQAEAEGLSLEEVEELTFFGLMAQETQRWSDVEQVLGGPVDDEVRAQCSALLDELNTEFKQSMRDLVAEGVSEDDRWMLIRSVQDDYRQRYFDLTGMDEDQLDDLLAGDASRDHAPGSTPPPPDVQPREDPPPPVQPRQGEPAPPR